MKRGSSRTREFKDRQGHRRAVVVSDVRRPLLGDLYHFFLNASWPTLLVILIGFFLVINTLFALAYLAGGDSIENAKPGSFVDAFFFSVQTIATIGYGKLAPHTVYANLVVTLEVISGLLGIAMLTGMVFAKFARPTARVLFSRVAVVAPRDGVPSLMFRMANQRGNQIVEAQLHVVMVYDSRTQEGEAVRRFIDLELSRSRNAIFELSWTAIHPISEGSPMYGATAESLAEMRAMFIVSLIGFDETFSQTVQARHAYVADEIIWNARLADIMSRQPDGVPLLDLTRFHEVVALETPSRHKAARRS